jgi:hypothetical protein
MMIMEEKRNISHLDFLHRLGMGAGVAMALTVMGPLCAMAQDEKKAAAPNRMTYSVQHGFGEQISLLGFGMMRLPNNQEEVNWLVDYATANPNTQPNLPHSRTIKEITMQ